jgi:hypothetical protein
MARIVCTYGSLDLNDGVTYRLLPGFDPGERELQFDELRGFAGGVAQVNASDDGLIAMKVPLLIEGGSAAGLRLAIEAINELVDEGEQVLRHDDGSGLVYYECARSPRVAYPRDELVAVGAAALVTFTPWRYP